MSTYSFDPKPRLDALEGQSSAERLKLLRAEKANQLQFGFGQILGLPLATLVGLASIFCVAFFNLSDLGVKGAEKISIDFTVLLKVGFLGMAGTYGAVGAYTDSRVRRLNFSTPVVWVWVLFGFYCLGVINSVIPKESVASAVSIACVLLGTTRLLIQVGVKVVLTTLFYALSAFVVASWFLFLFVPLVGVFEEKITEGELFRRMGGMAHPNTLGQFAGLTLVLVFLLKRNYGQMSKWRWAIALLALGALIGSVSRSSLIATFVAIGFIYRDQLFKREYLPYYLWAGMFGLVGLLGLAASTDLGAAIENKLAAVSKSGDASELTTGTGRVEIWAYAIKLIGQQPLFGYGAATTKWWLRDYSLYTHNMVLNVAFSTGIFGGLACLCMVFGRVTALIKRPHPIADGLLVFVLFNGISENVIFSILCGLPTIIWIVALSIPVLDEMSAEENTNGNGLPGSMGAIQ